MLQIQLDQNPIQPNTLPHTMSLIHPYMQTMSSLSDVYHISRFARRFALFRLFGKLFVAPSISSQAVHRGSGHWETRKPPELTHFHTMNSRICQILNIVCYFIEGANWGG